MSLRNIVRKKTPVSDVASETNQQESNSQIKREHIPRVVRKMFIPKTTVNASASAAIDVSTGAAIDTQLPETLTTSIPGTDLDKWVRDEYDMADLIINTKVCIHCMACKCKDENPAHNQVFFPREFSIYMSNPCKLTEISRIFRKTSIREPSLEGYHKVYIICLFNLMKSRCYNCKEGRCGKIKFDENTELTYCYPSTDKIRGNRVFVSLHLNVKLKSEDGVIKVNVHPYDNVGQYLRKYINRDDAYTGENDDNSISTQSTIQPLQIKSKKWANTVAPPSEQESTPEAPTTVESIQITQEDNSFDWYSPENHVKRTNCFIDYVCDENKHLMERIDSLESQMKELIDLNKQMIEQIKFLFNKESNSKKTEHDQRMKEYHQSIGKCNNSVSEVVGKTHFDEYFFFSY